MKAVLKPGDVLTIEFEGTDGQFQIHFDSQTHPKQIIVMETAGLPGSVLGEALGVFYVEDFRLPPKEKEFGPKELMLENQAPDKV